MLIELILVFVVPAVQTGRFSRSLGVASRCEGLQDFLPRQGSTAFLAVVVCEGLQGLPGQGGSSTALRGADCDAPLAWVWRRRSPT